MRTLKCRSWLVHLEKLSLSLLSSLVRSPCQSSPSFTIRVPLWFIISVVFFFLSIKLLFSGFLQFKGNNLVHGQNN